MSDWLKGMWDTYRRECLIGLIAIVVCGGLWLTRQNKGNNSSPQFATESSTKMKPTSSTRQSATICVDVKGAVNRAGVYRLPKGSRVEEALKAASGQTPEADMNQVNLAKQLQDAQVVYIPKHGEKVPTEFGGQSSDTSSGANAGSDSADKGPIVNLNSATKDQLQQLTGVGDKKADLIVAYRQAHGSFKSVDDLKKVQGFGDKTVAKLKDQLAV